MRHQLVIDLRQLEHMITHQCLGQLSTGMGSDSQLAAALHALRGLAMTIGAEQLVGLCLDLEQQLECAGPTRLLQKIARVLEESAQVRVSIAQRKDLQTR